VRKMLAKKSKKKKKLKAMKDCKPDKRLMEMIVKMKEGVVVGV
jgi:hypothetical protein